MVLRDQEILSLCRARDQRAIAALAEKHGRTATQWPTTFWDHRTRRSVSTTLIWRCGTGASAPRGVCWPIWQK
ncbi:MAG: hypothetical protein ACLS43_08005 [Evtepia gabavorous]